MMWLKPLDCSIFLFHEVKIPMQKRTHPNSPRRTSLKKERDFENGAKSPLLFLREGDWG